MEDRSTGVKGFVFFLSGLPLRGVTGGHMEEK